MDTFASDYITLDELYIAYRKAKVDAFYERDHATALDFAEYEIRLRKNLRRLHNELTQEIPAWYENSEIIGGYTYIPKSIEPLSDGHSDAPAIISDPDTDWIAKCKRKKADAQFRIVGVHPVDYHIISALWIQKVDHLYDAILKPCAYANRVRRLATASGHYHPPCQSSLGSFRPYSFGFRRWRANGFTAMQEALEAKKPIIAVTADLRKFYHRVSPRYLTNPDFLKLYNIHLSDNASKFTEQFVASLDYWAGETPGQTYGSSIGLPVGLSAPRLIANVILHTFDRFVTRELSPLYYGRYVDDVFIVLENNRELATSSDVWDFIIRRSDGLISRVEEDDEVGYKINLPYSSNSELIFVGKKQKVFVLEGTSGSSLLEAIMHTITKRSSDWRLLPDLPTDEEDLAYEFLNAGRDTAEEVDNLRKPKVLRFRGSVSLCDCETLKLFAAICCRPNGRNIEKGYFKSRWTT